MRTLNLKDDNGQTMILTVLCMTILLGFVGFATDIGVMFHTKRNMQIAADSAAIAAAQEFNYGGNWSTAGQAAAAQNGMTNGVNGAVVSINNPPVYGAFAGNANYVEAVVTQTQPTFFAILFNVASMDVSGHAVATTGPSTGCIYTLFPGGTGLAFNGITVSVPSCSITDDSTGNPGGLAANAGAVNAQSIGVVGGYTNAGASVNPAPITGMVPVNDPLAYLTPPAFNPASCQPDPAPTVATTLTQGCYNGLTIGGLPGTVVTLSGGTYIINGTLTINGTPTIDGNGVTFYFPNAAASFIDGGGETWNITAPTTGAYNGLLFFEDASDTNSLTFNNTANVANSLLEGIVYAPSANVTINSDTTTTLYESIDAGSLTLSGPGTLQDYAAINNASVLTATRLVE